MDWRKLLSAPIIFLIRVYQVGISSWMPSSCRYAPSCSGYFIQAVQMHGPFYGSWLGLKRIGRCHPWGGQGYDPVPAPKKTHKQ